MSIPREITGVSKPETAFSQFSQPPPSLAVHSDQPCASTSALSFLQNINLIDLKYALFTDELATFTDVDSEMGVYRATAKMGCYKGEETILVEAKSEGNVDGIYCSTEVIANLNQSLQTVNQELYERINLTSGPMERTTKLELATEGYLITKTIKQASGTSVQERLFEHTLMEGYISEGANIVLQRVMMTKGLPDYCELLSFDSDTNLCQCTYMDLVDSDICVENKYVKCYGLARKIQSLTDVPVMWHTYFLPDGHLVSRVQVGSPVLMKVRHLPALVEHDEYLEKPIIGVKELDWKTDLQLTSLFQDRKEELISNYKQYCRDHPELQALMADFLQSLLLHKPQNTLHFASAFFSTFSNRFDVDPPIMDSRKSNLLLSDH